MNVFRRSDAVPEVVEQAIQIKAPAIWMQEGVIHEEAAEKARQAGIFVVMDLCILKEHRRRSKAFHHRGTEKQREAAFLRSVVVKVLGSICMNYSSNV